MAKNDLLSGSLWDKYSKKVQERMNNPKNLGEITEEDARKMGGKLVVAEYGAESCGDAVRLYWVVDEATNKIIEAKFKSFGCATAIASSDTMADLCKGKTVDEAVKITNIDVERAMRDKPDIPAVPPQKMHCSVMAYDVIKKAASKYKGVELSSFEDDIIVCKCARVTLSTIKDAIKINKLKTVKEITDYTKAGAFCKSCIKPDGHEKRDYYLVDILADVRAEYERNKSDKDSFENLTIIQKFKTLENVAENYIRPLLLKDGGDIEIVDVIENVGFVDVYVKYLGACSSCASRNSTTLYNIEKILKEKISGNVRVFSV